MKNIDDKTKVQSIGRFPMFQCFQDTVFSSRQSNSIFGVLAPLGWLRVQYWRPLDFEGDLKSYLSQKINMKAGNVRSGRVWTFDQNPRRKSLLLGSMKLKYNIVDQKQGFRTLREYDEGVMRNGCQKSSKASPNRSLVWYWARILRFGEAC